MTYNQNQKDILQYARSIVSQGFAPGVLMIDEGWFRTYGDWEFDCARFEDPKALIDELHRVGFKVMLWVCPYITPAGTFFTNLRHEQTEQKRTVWIRNAQNPDDPAIMEWWDGFSAVADLTSPDGIRWFKGHLDRLIERYGVDGFKFDGGDAEYASSKTMLVPVRSYQRETTANQHSEAFARFGLEYPLNEFRACWKMGGQAIAQRLRDKEHNWTDLNKLIPGLITQGLMGYPFSCPDLIGGGEYLSFRHLDKVDQELIVRAAQCHALAPMMQFSVAPWRVLSPENLEICVKMARLHTEMGEEILALAKESAQSGEPIVRSLEFEYPGKGYGGVTDQFLLGPSILVAPVLQKGAVQRTIQFPPGTWKGEDGSVVKGPSRIEVPAPLARLPWYRKVTTASGL
jgi:alpha-glucosidase